MKMRLGETEKSVSDKRSDMCKGLELYEYGTSEGLKEGHWAG